MLPPHGTVICCAPLPLVTVITLTLVTIMKPATNGRQAKHNILYQLSAAALQLSEQVVLDDSTG